MKRSTGALAAILSLWASASLAASAYTPVATLRLGAPDRWDYVVFDGPTQRVYIAHGDRLTVVDAATARMVGQVTGIPGGTHGIAISTPTGQGFTDDGANGKAIAFDLKTLKITHTLPADFDADSITLDPLTGHVFLIAGDPGTITVVDPATDAVVAGIKGGEKMEYGVTDGKGAVYVAGEEKGDLLKIDARSNLVVGRWPVPGCSNPHGLAIDRAGHRLFMGCVNSVMVVINAADGHIVTTLPIGRGSDAIAYDPVRRRVFSSNGVDGTISIYQKSGLDTYVQLPSVITLVSARTMTVDPRSGRLFVAGADISFNARPNSRPQFRQGSLKLLVFDPVR